MNRSGSQESYGEEYGSPFVRLVNPYVPFDVLPLRHRVYLGRGAENFPPEGRWFVMPWLVESPLFL